MKSEKNLAVEIWDIERLIPYAGNAKKHPADQIAKLVKSIRAFGWTSPIVVDAEGVVIAGHGRRLAALEMGLKKIPVVCRNDLTPEEANALRLADNRTVSTNYDTSLLHTELLELSTQGFDLDLLGFDAKELDFMTSDLGEMDLSSITEDIGVAVETQKEENNKKTSEVDQITTSVGDAFGFKKVTVEQMRTIRAFIGKIEDETGKQGAEALIAHIIEKDYA